jgi:DNA adenine methylase
LSQAHLRLARVTVENLGWRECIARYDRPGTLFFLDPPYWQTEGYGGDFGLEQYEQMASVMSDLQGLAILTINDHPSMRQVFGKYRRKRIGISYTLGGGGKPKAAAELIYRTW